METKNYVVPKLSGNNYFMWKIKMEMVLQKEKLWNIVLKDPPSTMNDEWKIKDQSARATIGLALDDHLLISITDCETSKQTWNKLKQTYEHSNLTCKLFLLKKLYGSKFEMHRNMEEYINSVKELAERLRVIGESVKESHIIAIILCGLPSHFDSLVTAIESRDEKDINMEYICVKLRDEAARKESQNETESQQENAMATREYSGVGMRRGKIICHQCGKEGHIRRNCDYHNNYDKFKIEGQNKKSEPYQDRNSHQSLATCEPTARETIDLNEEWALSGTQPLEEYKERAWVLDSGASAHMTSDKTRFTDICDIKQPTYIHMANGERAEATGKGKIILTFKNNTKNCDIELKDALYVPNLKLQLISVKKLCQEGYTIVFDNYKCVVQQKENTILMGELQGSIYVVKSIENQLNESALTCCIHQWHNRLGHRSLRSIQFMANNDLVNDLKIARCDHDNFCQSCQLGAMKQRTFTTSSSNASQPFKTLVTDLCGPINPASMGGSHYIMTFTDQFSGYVQVELLQNKHEAADALIRLIKRGKNQFGRWPEILRSDGGGEYHSHRLSEFFKLHGIIHQTSVPHTAQQNGQAERMNRTILNEIRSIIVEGELPLNLWGEIAHTAAYLNNRTVSIPRNQTPYQLWFNKRPSVGHLRTVGSIAYSHVPKVLRTKLGETATKGKIVGYGLNKKCYRVWIPGTMKIINSTSTVCNESIRSPDTDYHNKTENTIIFPQDSEEGEPNVIPRTSSRVNKGIPAKRLSY